MVLATRSRLALGASDQGYPIKPTTNQSALRTPLKEHRSNSSPSQADTFDALAQTQTPIANCSYLENDSPLPSPPSLSKPKDAQRPVVSSIETSSNVGSEGPSGGAVATAFAPHSDRQTYARPVSPTPAPSSHRTGRRSQTGDQPSYQDVDLTNAKAVDTLSQAPPSYLERRAGTKVAPAARPNSSQGWDHRKTSQDWKNARDAGGSSAYSHGLSANAVAGPSSGSSRPISSAFDQSQPYRSTSSQARRTRERTIDPVPSEASGKKRTWGGEEVHFHRRASDERVESDIGYEGKTSSGSDRSARPVSTLREPDSPPAKAPLDSVAFSTPALTTGTRTLRSQIGTAGRSTARTLKRYGAGEARPQHVRPTRVMLTQGADDSDGEDEEEPGVGVGTSPQQPKAKEVPSIRSVTLQRDSKLSELGRLNTDSAESSPRLQSTSKFLDGLSLRAHPGNSPRSTLHASDDRSSSSECRGDIDSESNRRKQPKSTSTSTAASTASLSRSRDKVDGVVAARIPVDPHPEQEARAQEAVQMGADEQDDVDAEEEAAAAESRPSRAWRATGARKESPSLTKATVPHDGRPLQVETDDKENESPKPAPQQSQARVYPIDSNHAGQTRQTNPASVLEGKRPLHSQQSAAANIVRACDRQTRKAETVEKRIHDTSPPRHATGEGEARIAAEKMRLLELNGWDPYVQAALEEADRQRRNGCIFGEQMVGKPMSSRKETKFRGAKYLKVSRAGEGGFSTVFQVLGPVTVPTMDGGNEPVPAELQGYFAMKQVSLKRLEQSSRDELLQEAQLLESLAEVPDSDKYVLRYFGHKHSGDTLKIMMELGEMDFNTLLRTQHPLPRSALSEYWRQMLESVHFVHNAKLVHTDLKPANFLMVKGRIKLIDFGIAQKIPLGTMHISRDVIVGTPNYMAPEAIQKARRGGHGVYKAGKPSDVWSLGCILYQMVYGRTPFAHITGDRKLEVITDPRHQIAFPSQRSLDESRQLASDGGDNADQIPEELDEIMLDCLRASLLYKAQERATIPELLEHLFVRDEVTLSRQKLKSIVLRIQTYMQQGGLNEANVEEMAERLMTNLQLDVFEQFPAIGAAS